MEGTHENLNKVVKKEIDCFWCSVIDFIEAYNRIKPTRANYVKLVETAVAMFRKRTEIWEELYKLDAEPVAQFIDFASKLTPEMIKELAQPLSYIDRDFNRELESRKVTFKDEPTDTTKEGVK